MKISATSSEMAPTIELDASEHPIKAVTVFTSRKAEVVRTFTVELEEGQNEIHITSIPSCIDTDSARITGLGDAILFDVVCTVAPSGRAFGHQPLFGAPPTTSPPVTSPTIKALERARSVLTGEKTLRGHAGDILVQYGRSMNAETNPGGLEAVDALLDAMLGRGAQVLKEAEELDAKIEEVDRAIEQERKKLTDEARRPAMTGSVTAVIMSKKQGSVEITLTYMVANASWAPTYDLRATTENGRPPSSVSLHYRAVIKQTTGEDWRSTSISVSTATPGQWQTVPSLRAMWISPAGASSAHTNKGGVPLPSFQSAFGNSRPVQQQQQQQQQQSQQQRIQQQQQRYPQSNNLFGGFGGSTMNTTPAFGFAGQQPGSTSTTGTTTAFGASSIPPTQQTAHADTSDSWTSVEPPEVISAAEAASNADPQRSQNAVNVEDDAADGWAETKAVITESAVSSAFHIEGSCSIPSGQTPHKVAIAILKFDAKVNYVAVPRTMPSAFLQCEVTNTSQYRLLPGPVNVYLDNSPVSKASIPHVNPDEYFKCTFGPDPSIRIKCTRLPRTVASAGSQYAAQTTVTTYKLRTLIQNTHTFAISGLVVRDAVPTPATSPAAAGSPTSGIKVLLKRPEGLGEAEVGEVVTVDASGEEKGKGNLKARVRWPTEAARKVGKYEWVVAIGAGEEVKLDAEYDVRAPSDFNWVLTEEFYAE